MTLQLYFVTDLAGRVKYVTSGYTMSDKELFMGKPMRICNGSKTILTSEVHSILVENGRRTVRTRNSIYYFIAE